MKRENIISVYVDKEEKVLYERRAREMGVSISAMIRMTVNNIVHSEQSKANNESLKTPASRPF